MVNHFLATSKKEALELLASHKLTIIAGGTDIMVQRRSWANTAPAIDASLNIIHLEELNYIVEKDHQLHIGAITPLSDILENPATPELLKKAIYDIASPGLRNIATIAGNIGNASPAGDTLPILYLYDAIIVLESLQGKREVPIQEVITGVRKTTIRDDEMITEIIFPLLPFTKTTFVKVGGRKADAISKLSFTGAVLLEANKINDIRMVFGAVAPTMVRSKQIEDQLIGKTIDQAQELLDDILDLYQELIQPIDDQRSTKIYRKHVSLQLVMDFILNL